MSVLEKEDFNFLMKKMYGNYTNFPYMYPYPVGGYIPPSHPHHVIQQQQPVMYYAYPMQMPMQPIQMPMQMPQYMVLPAPTTQLSQAPEVAANAQLLTNPLLNVNPPSLVKCFHCGVDGHKAIHCPTNPEWCGESSALCSVHGKVRSISSLQQKESDDKDTWECLPTSRCRMISNR